MAPTVNAYLSEAHRRLGSLYGFLREFAHWRHPVDRDVEGLEFRLWLDELPEHEAIERGWLDDEADFALCVTRPQLTRCPDPPEPLSGWLRSGWEDPRRTVDIMLERTHPAKTPEAPPEIERFDDAAARVAALRAWAADRDAWTEVERPARDAMRVFERLYELHGMLDRERERFEVYAGDAILRWATRSGHIHHPLVIQALQLDFEPSIPRFTVLLGERPAELYTALLRSIDEVDGRVLAPANSEFDRGEYGPFSGSEIDGYLKALAVRLHRHGVYGGASSTPGDIPAIYRRRLLMLRRRTQGFGTALEAIESDLQEREDLPVSLRSIVGIHEALTQNDAALAEQPGTARLANEAPDLLFTKPANGEQERIARQLESHGAVMVQGPPGTGKTHTIANLIGHLLAQGKRILVTSHTAKALERVREVIVEELQPLAVSVVGGDATEREQLEHSVREITSRLASDDANHLRQEAQRLREYRRRVIDELTKHRRELHAAVHAEYRDIVVAGEGVNPSDAAREVTSGRGRDDWVPGPVAGADFTISPSEVLELYETNSTVGAEHERELSRPLPPANDVPSPLDFRAQVSEERALKASDRVTGRKFWHAYPSQAKSRSIEQLAKDSGEAADSIRDLPGWEFSLLEAGMRGGGHRQAWEDLLVEIKEVRELADQAAPRIAQYGPRLPKAIPLDRTAAILHEISAHLAEGGSLGRLARLWHRPWDAVLTACKVEVGSARDPAAVDSLYALSKLELARERLRGRWRRTAEAAGMPAASDLGPEPEIKGKQFVTRIQKLLDWHDATWKPLVKRAHAIGLDVDALMEASGPRLEAHGEVIRLVETARTHLPATVSATSRQLKLDAIREKLARIDHGLAPFTHDARPADVARSLRQAVRTRNRMAYESAHERLNDLRTRLPAWRKRNTLLERLAKVAPAWAEAVKRRQGPHAADQPPDDTNTAWRWRVLNDELTRRAAVDPTALQAEIYRLEEELRRVTAKLVDQLAWAAQIEGTSQQQRQSLNGWMQAMQKVGKGTGKRAPRLRTAARQYMGQSREAVPVWIMPMSHVVEAFDFGTTRFDVLIVDEASQSDLLGLAALYIADQVVVVGDDEQVSPEAVGQQVDQVERLIDQFLSDIPNGELYDGRASIYDLGTASFGGTVRLREHFRCVPEIIEFSNQLSYQGTIQPLRDASNVRRRPAVIAERVNGVRDQHENRTEAEFIVSTIIAACEFAEYRDATFGVIAMLGQGGSQARLIDSMLRQRMLPVERERRRVLVGSPAHFQGDERDVVFISLVDSPTDGPLSLRRDDRFKKRYNVAASRAKDQMWVVHSLNPEVDLQPEDLRARLIRHATQPAAIAEQIADQENLTESPLEKRVLEDLVRAGYQIEAQHRVGALRIDLVAHGADSRRVAIECDGDRWHTTNELDADLSRQALLERLGWRFIRIRGSSEYYRDPEATIARVRERLSELGVTPTSDIAVAQPASSDLLDRIRARAAEIGQSWQEENQDLGEFGSLHSDLDVASTADNVSKQSRSRIAEPVTSTADHPLRHYPPRGEGKRRASVRSDSDVAESPPPTQIPNTITPTETNRTATTDNTRERSDDLDVEVRAEPVNSDEVPAMSPTGTTVQMPLKSALDRVGVATGNTGTVPTATEHSQQTQLLRERGALQVAYDALSAQSGRPGKVDLARLIPNHRGLTRAMRVSNRPLTTTRVRKRAARRVIKAAIAAIDAELATL